MSIKLETLMDYSCSVCHSRDSLSEQDGKLFCPECKPVELTFALGEIDLVIWAMETVHGLVGLPDCLTTKKRLEALVDRMYNEVAFAEGQLDKLRGNPTKPHPIITGYNRLDYVPVGETGGRSEPQ